MCTHLNQTTPAHTPLTPPSHPSHIPHTSLTHPSHTLTHPDTQAHTAHVQSGNTELGMLVDGMQLGAWGPYPCDIRIWGRFSHPELKGIPDQRLIATIRPLSLAGRWFERPRQSSGVGRRHSADALGYVGFPLCFITIISSCTNIPHPTYTHTHKGTQKCTHTHKHKKYTKKKTQQHNIHAKTHRRLQVALHDPAIHDNHLGMSVEETLGALPPAHSGNGAVSFSCGSRLPPALTMLTKHYRQKHRMARIRRRLRRNRVLCDCGGDVVWWGCGGGDTYQHTINK